MLSLICGVNYELISKGPTIKYVTLGGLGVRVSVVERYMEVVSWRSLLSLFKHSFLVCLSITD